MLANALDTKKSLQVFNLQGFISWGARTDSNRRHSEPQASCQIYRNPCVYRHFSVSAFSFCANFATNFRRVVFKHNFKFGNILFA